MAARLLNLTLWALTIIFLLFVVIGNDDPAARVYMFRDVLPETAWHARTIYKGLYDFGMGGLVSLLFYLLLVRVPENAKRARMRKSLDREYKHLKEDCLFEILGTVDEIVDMDRLNELLDQNAFRTYFTERVRPDQDRWDVFMNKLERPTLRRILAVIERFRGEVAFTLSTVDIDGDGVFEFFKRFSVIAYDIQGSGLGYDEIKPLARFLWELLSGFSFVSGYQKEDLVAKMIRSI